MTVSRTLAACAAAVAVAAVTVGVVVVLRGTAGNAKPASPTPTATVPVGQGGAADSVSTTLPPADPSYWSEERRRNAQPAPMPTE